MKKRLKEDPMTMVYAMSILSIIFIVFMKIHTVNAYGNLIDVLPDRDCVELVVGMSDGSAQVYVVDYDTPIENDADTVEFETWIWAKGDFDEYKVNHVYREK